MYILFLDLDRFQQLNKEYGFRTGDRILKAMVEYLAMEFPGDPCSRENDHFALLTERNDYERRLRRIQQRLSSFVQNHFAEAIDRGYILPYYQPIIASLSGVCSGFEALAR